MARIFTVDFEFKGGQHAAVVSTWRSEAQADIYQIALHDEAFQDLVPEGIVRFSTADDNTPQTDPDRAELVHCLKRVVKGYLQKLSV